jgi:membrane-associated phospholipid phosphatase
VFGGTVDDAARGIGYAGSAWVLAPVALALLAWHTARSQWRGVFVVVTASCVAWLVNPLLKQVFSRERPTVRELVDPTSTFSFPSGHAVASAAFATVIVCLAWPTRWRHLVVIGTTLTILAIGWSQLVLGRHYPSDLIAGWALAVAIVTAVTVYAGDRRGSSSRPG